MSDESAAGLTKTTDELALVEFLRERDVECPLCGYNLRQLQRARCPECGRDLELRVGLAEPRQGAWLMAQVAVTGAGGIGLIALVSCTMHGWPDARRFQWVMNLQFAYYLAAIPIAAALLWQRRRYLRMPRAWQWTSAWIAAIVTFVSIFAFVVTD